MPYRPRTWIDQPYDISSRHIEPKYRVGKYAANKPTRPPLRVIEGGKEITPSPPTNKPKTGLSFLGKTFSQIVGLGGKANVFSQIVTPTPLSDGTMPEGWKPPSPEVDMSAQDIKIGSLDITVYAQDELPRVVDPEVVTLPPLPPSYHSELPILLDPRAPVVLDRGAEGFYQPPYKMEPPQLPKYKRTQFISFEDVHVGNPYREVNNEVRKYTNAFGDKRWLGQTDVIITSTDYKPYDEAAAIAEYEAWLAEQNRLINDIDVRLQTRALSDGRTANIIDEIYYRQEKIDQVKPGRLEIDKFTELTVELLTSTKVNTSTRLAVRAGSNTKRRRDGKSRYGEAYLALKRVIDATIGGELPELYFMFTDNLISKPMGRKRPPMRKGYLSFWDPRVQQWRYKAKTPYGIYVGFETGFLELDAESFIVDVAYNFVEDALIGKVMRKAKKGHDSMLQQFGKTDREIGFAFGSTL